MKVVTLRGTYNVSLDGMKVRDAQGRERALRRVPSPVIGERMEIETVEDGVESTEQVTEVRNE